MHILLDTDVVLDLFLDREPFAEAAAIIWQAHEQASLTAYISAITPINLFYIARKLKGRDIARQAINELLATLPVCTIDHAILQVGAASDFKDFEDAVQYASAVAGGMEAIVTRNIKDYQSASLPVYTPEDFLRQFPLANEG